jgi:hypothetical protein
MLTRMLVCHANLGPPFCMRTIPESNLPSAVIIPPGCHFGFCHVFLWPVRQNTEILKDSTPETSNEYISTTTYPNHFKMPPAAFADHPLTVRAIVIAFQVFYNMEWIEMSPKLEIQPDTARKFFLRTREIAGGSMDLWDLLLHAPAHAQLTGPLLLSLRVQSLMKSKKQP